MHQAILTHLSHQTEPVTVAHVACALGQSAYDTRQALHELATTGQVRVVRSEKRGERFAAVT